MSEQRHAWYSQKMADQNGTAFWLNAEGDEVEVTEVTTEKRSVTQWDDVEYRGVVVKYARNGKDGTLLKYKTSRAKFYHSYIKK